MCEGLAARMPVATGKRRAAQEPEAGAAGAPLRKAARRAAAGARGAEDGRRRQAEEEEDESESGSAAGSGSGSSSGPDEESEEESEEGPEVGLDQHGRIYPGVEGPCNYGFRALDNCLRAGQGSVAEALVADCRAVFTARQAEDDVAYSAGETYFVGADAEPRCALERLALDVFRFHAEGLRFDPARSGAEWWTLVLDAEDSDVSWHWDKDYGMEDFDVNVFPNISTVTYCAAAGGATMVLEKTAPPRASADVSGPAGPHAMVSRPKLGKHISFDGRFLHYASTDLLGLFPAQPKAQRAPSPPAGPRVTFLVNVWFNHRPQDAVVLPQDVLGRLTLPATEQLWTPQGMRPQRPIELRCEAAHSQLDYPLGGDKSGFSVLLRLPGQAKLAPVGADADSILIEFDPQALPLVVANGTRAPDDREEEEEEEDEEDEEEDEDEGEEQDA